MSTELARLLDEIRREYPGASDALVWCIAAVRGGLR